MPIGDTLLETSRSSATSSQIRENSELGRVGGRVRGQGKHLLDVCGMQKKISVILKPTMTTSGVGRVVI